jgi:hypothetical protein
MFQRGVAAAIGGQRIAAADLLRAAVRLDPQHEHAWLWLSGVLDDRDDVVLCLRAVLRINPENRRARQGLAQLNSSSTPVGDTQPAARQDLKRSTDSWAVAAPRRPEPRGATWHAPRRSPRALVVLLWLLPITLLAITAGARIMIETGPLLEFVSTSGQLLPTMPAASPTSAATTTALRGNTAVAEEPGATAEAMDAPLSSASAPDEQGAVMESYFRTVTAERDRLQSAVYDYRGATKQSQTMLARVDAARTLSDQIGQAYATLQAIEPPAMAATAHRSYLEGLASEQQALQDLLAFYGSYNAADANRAAIRLQEARDHISNATAAWDAVASEMRGPDAD